MKKLALMAATALFTTIAIASDSVIFVASDDLDTYWLVEENVAPVYPTKALRSGEQGCVTVGFIIEPDGTTSNHRALASAPSRIFEKSAINAAKQFLYKPSETNSAGQAVYTTSAFTFQITKSEELDENRIKKLAAVCDEAANKALNSDAGDAGAG